MSITPSSTLQPNGRRQREHSLREMFNDLCHVVKTGTPWRWMPNDLPPQAAACQQAQHWLADCLDA